MHVIYRVLLSMTIKSLLSGSLALSHTARTYSNEIYAHKSKSGKVLFIHLHQHSRTFLTRANAGALSSKPCLYTLRIISRAMTSSSSHGVSYALRLNGCLTSRVSPSKRDASDRCLGHRYLSYLRPYRFRSQTRCSGLDSSNTMQSRPT
ncbi:hypothetical protein RSAG8_10880, partial [Rhizoctonia solani AG-8 WAC10335]